MKSLLIAAALVASSSALASTTCDQADIPSSVGYRIDGPEFARFEALGCGYNAELDAYVVLYRHEGHRVAHWYKAGADGRLILDASSGVDKILSDRVECPYWC